MKVAAHIRLKHGRLWEIMEKHGLTVVDLAELCGVNRAQIYPVVNLKRRPSEALATKLQIACGTLDEYLDPATEWPEAFIGFSKTAETRYAECDVLALGAAAEPRLQLVQKELLEEAIESVLYPRERRLVEKRFAGERMADIANEIGRTHMRVRQIVDRATVKIRKYVESEQ